MRIGAKTITALTLLAACAVGTTMLGRLRGDYLAQLDIWAGFTIGIFSVLAASAVFHLGRLGQASEHHLRIGPGGSPRVERTDPFGHLPRRRSARVRRTRSAGLMAAYIAIFLQVGLLTIDNRGVAQLTSVSKAFEPSGLQYCLEAPPPKAEDPRLAGCGLLRRAYQLGYASDLGPCAPQERTEITAVCDRRQLDEPYLHYAWRLLQSRRPALVPDVIDEVRSSLAKVEERRDHLGALLLARRDPVARTPRASHHLFTNLPAPRSGIVPRVVEALDAAACDARTARMPPLLTDIEDDPLASSLIVEHAMGQLLFNPAYPTVVASCREHTIHWNSAADSCERMLNDPDGYLATRRVLGEVRAVLGRHRRAKLSAGLAKDDGRTPSAPAPPDVSRVISFQCLMLGPTPSALRSRTATVAGHALGIRSVTVTPFSANVRGQIQVFDHLARLLAPGFRYGKLQSKQSLVEADAGRAAAQRFARPTSLLTKLELLRETDIFLGHPWIDDRPDLLAVYPYHVHLTNFVEAFRRHYRHARSRL